jgi:hypothetical protein
MVSKGNRQETKDELQDSQERPSESLSKNAKLGLLLGLVFVFVIAFLLNLKSIPLTHFHFLILPGAGLAVIGGLCWALGRELGPVAAELKIGNVEFKLSAPFLLILAGLTLGTIGAFLGSRVMWGVILSEETLREKVSEEIAELIPEQYRKLLALETKMKDKKMSEDERLASEAEDLYESGAYDDCVELLKAIDTQNDSVLEKVLYYSIMARYRCMEIMVRRYEPVSEEQTKDLESRFLRFVKERPESTYFCTVHYWLGQFYLQICNRKGAALQVFDDIVNDYFYSAWVQGSLYYSAILHYEKDSLEDREIAVKRLKSLSKVDGDLRIVEVNRDFDGAALAKSMLTKWGALAQKAKPTSESPLNRGAHDPCAPPANRGE